MSVKFSTDIIPYARPNTIVRTIIGTYTLAFNVEK